MTISTAVAAVSAPTAAVRRLVRRSYGRHTAGGKEVPPERLRSPTGRACRWACQIRDFGSYTRGRWLLLPARRRCSRGRCEGGRRVPIVVLPVRLCDVRCTASVGAAANA